MSKLQKRTAAEVYLFEWDHPGYNLPDTRSGRVFTPVKEWIDEVIMDFGYVTQNLDYLASKLPVADMYVGHSAGGVIVGSSTVRPQVLMGCPFQLIRNVQLRAHSTDVLNIMHYRDLIATPVIAAQNVIINRPFITGWLNPVKAHTCYWTSNAALDYTVRMFEARVRR